MSPKRRRVLGAATFLAALVPVVSTAQVSAPSSDPFTSLFAQTCMQHHAAPEALRAMLGEWGAAELPAEAAAPFLGGGAGTAWALVRADVRYAVALQSTGICAVFAQRADVAAVRRHFAAIVAASPAPLVAHELPSPASAPNAGALRTISYAWTREGDASELAFTLTTSDEPVPRIQAMASLATVKKSEP